MTLAGVITAFFIPMKEKWGKSPLLSLEHALAPYVLFGIVPIFAFANAGVVFEGITFPNLFDPLPLGIAAGLILGKQIGVFGTTSILVKTSVARKPFGAGHMPDRVHDSFASPSNAKSQFASDAIHYPKSSKWLVVQARSPCPKNPTEKEI